MTLFQVRNVNFGSSKLNATGSTGVGYTILDSTGSIAVSRITGSVYQTAPGIYAANVEFPDNFRGSILWDTGTAFSSVTYATEQYNYEENNANVDSSSSTLTAISGTVNSTFQMLTAVSGNVDVSLSMLTDISGTSNTMLSMLTDVSGTVNTTFTMLSAVSGTVDTTLQMLTAVSGTISSLYHMQFGRWKIIANQMIFYKDDNATEIARFNLFDINSNPTMDAVFDRVKV